MRQSRSERYAGKKSKHARLYRKLAGTAAIAILLAIGIYYGWHFATAWMKDNDAREARPSAETEQIGQEAIDRNPSDDQSQQDGQNQQADAEDTEAVHQPKPEESEVESKETIQLMLVGDIMMGGRIDGLLRNNGFDYPYKHVGHLLREADIAAGNLENPITSRGEPLDKQYTFRTSPDAIPAIQESGFDVFNLANNHTLDYGLIGMRDTIKLLDEAGIGHMGAGEDEIEAFSPYTVEKNGMRIDFLGFTNVVPDVTWKADKGIPGLAETYNYTRAIQAIERSDKEADLVVVFVHWGLERQNTPEPYMIENAHRYIDAGADLVVGSHPHVLAGIESYNDKWIAYSLGNFIFTVNPNAPSKDSMILQADCESGGDCSLTVLPMLTGIGQPLPASAEESEALFAQLSLLSIGAEVNRQGEVVKLE
jgi:poly-gamma-glutamate capsule biosynthesis protein CapA/YwtB (metallophosphatase superfamily)